MSEKELLEKIEQLELKLESFHQKENYINNGVLKTKEIYEVARHNSERIIIKTIDIAYGLKQKLEEILKDLTLETSSSENIKQHIKEINTILYNKEEIKEISKKIVDSIK
ncbi:hypothetical protein [Spiroplasma culicicola]|uniref:Uncharacterized protein n=1 Tax=Spiroplasma culicicola AES-1 TaxID=1276246 RepID=W6A887_9MOLU|nr:hypothetical protein [Spiroplasma culicicola]AHI53110.1 hypothetical protein SCULI_v1c07690 [Spiroplasma culicicola AES-1]